VADRRDGLIGRTRERLGTVRARTTLVAVIVVGAALVVAAIAMVVLLRRSLTGQVRSAAILQAQSVAEEEVRFRQASGAGIPVGDEDEQFAQVLDPQDGRVLDSSANVRNTAAVVRLRPGETARIETTPFEDDPFLVVAITAMTQSGQPRTVIVGRTLDSVGESTSAVVGLLAAGVPLLLLLVGGMTWLSVGRVLAPVESIRAEVEAISTAELHRRVPDPRGRDEIARLATTMNHMLARLQAGQTRQRRFVSDASHELRSPVTTIRQQAEVALTHPDGTSTQELSEVVLEEAARLQRLVEDLLLLAKLDEGTLHLRAVPVDLDDLLFETAERLRGTTDLHVDTSGVSAGRVLGDRDQLERLVRNLADNAARHARRTVALSVRQEGDQTVLAIDDDGEGIPPSDRARIFERFKRLDEARDRDSGGSGLGLAIVAEIASAHGAAIEVVDGPLGGARFVVRFRARGD
jgi:signal transduction histidine kinase